MAASWALAHPDGTIAVVAALPAWTGASDGAPASLSARHTAALLRRDGLAATTAAMRASSPAWLADELARSWQRQWPSLPAALDEAAGFAAPSREELSLLTAPLAVVGPSTTRSTRSRWHVNGLRPHPGGAAYDDVRRVRPEPACPW